MCLVEGKILSLDKKCSMKSCGVTEAKSHFSLLRTSSSICCEQVKRKANHMYHMRQVGRTAVEFSSFTCNWLCCGDVATRCRYIANQNLTAIIEKLLRYYRALYFGGNGENRQGQRFRDNSDFKNTPTSFLEIPISSKLEPSEFKYNLTRPV